MFFMIEISQKKSFCFSHLDETFYLKHLQIHVYNYYVHVDKPLFFLLVF
jgi:hypothetical protein